MPTVKQKRDPRGAIVSLVNISQEEYDALRHRYAELRSIIAKGQASPEEVAEAIDAAFALERDEDIPALREERTRAVDRQRRAAIERQRHARKESEKIESLLANVEKLGAALAAIDQTLEEGVDRAAYCGQPPESIDPDALSGANLDQLAAILTGNLRRYDAERGRLAGIAATIDRAITKRQREGVRGIVSQLVEHLDQCEAVTRENLEAIEHERQRRAEAEHERRLEAESPAVADLMRRVAQLERIAGGDTRA